MEEGAGDPVAHAASRPDAGEDEEEDEEEGSQEGGPARPSGHRFLGLGRKPGPTMHHQHGD